VTSTVKVCVNIGGAWGIVVTKKIKKIKRKRRAHYAQWNSSVFFFYLHSLVRCVIFYTALRQYIIGLEEFWSVALLAYDTAQPTLRLIGTCKN
jgi:hypothetical protein